MTGSKLAISTALAVTTFISAVCFLSLLLGFTYGAPCRKIQSDLPHQSMTVGENSFFVQATNSYGRYTNMRRALITSAALARYLNRTLIYAPFGNCLDDESVDDVLDFSLLDARPMLANLKPLCRPHAPSYAAMLMQRACPLNGPGCTEPAASARPPVPTFAFAGGFMWHAMYPEEEQTWSLQSMISRAGRHQRCVGVQGSFYLRFVVTEDVHKFTSHREEVERLLLPSKPIRDAVHVFLGKHDLASKQFTAMHLRLTDIGAKTSERGLGCSVDVHAIVGKVKSFGDMPVLLATDDELSNCTRVVVNSLNVTFVRSGIWDPRSCMEAAFVQEVMGHATALVGIEGSSFSSTIETIRRIRGNQTLEGYMFPV